MTTTLTPAEMARASDHRGSPVPNGAMIRTRIMEIRKRRGLMAALVAVNIGIPALFLAIRLILHAVDPHSFSAAGGYSTFDDMTEGVLFVFGFIVAATLGCFAGSADLTEGVFRHLVVTGRSRVALYFARIPAGLAILVPLVAVGFTIVCAICVFAAPPKVSYDGVDIAPGLSHAQFVRFSEDHAGEVACSFFYRNLNVNVPCGPNGKDRLPPSVAIPSKAVLQRDAVKIADQNYDAYKQTFRTPPLSLMVEAGLWVELEAALGFVVGLGLASLMGQRTVPVVIMIVFEVILTPLLANHALPHFINAQRALVGAAMAHIEPSQLPPVFGGGQGPGAHSAIYESTPVAICVIIAWIVGWSALGAWRMARRDA